MLLLRIGIREGKWAFLHQSNSGSFSLSLSALNLGPITFLSALQCPMGKEGCSRGQEQRLDFT